MNVGLGDEVVDVLDVLGEVPRVLVEVHAGDRVRVFVHDGSVLSLEVSLLVLPGALSQPRQVNLRLHQRPERLHRPDELAHPRLRLARVPEHLLALHELRDDGVKRDDRQLVRVQHEQKRTVLAPIYAVDFQPNSLLLQLDRGGEGREEPLQEPSSQRQLRAAAARGGHPRLFFVPLHLAIDGEDLASTLAFLELAHPRVVLVSLDVGILVVQLSPPGFHGHQRDAHAVHGRVVLRALLPLALGLFSGFVFADDDDAVGAASSAAAGSTRAVGVRSGRVLCRAPGLSVDGVVHIVHIVHTAVHVVVARVFVHELMGGEQGSRRGLECAVS